MLGFLVIGHFLYLKPLHYFLYNWVLYALQAFIRSKLIIQHGHMFIEWSGPLAWRTFTKVNARLEKKYDKKKLENEREKDEYNQSFKLHSILNKESALVRAYCITSSSWAYFSLWCMSISGMTDENVSSTLSNYLNPWFNHHKF